MDSVVLETSVGDVQLELYWDHAPKVLGDSHLQSDSIEINRWSSRLAKTLQNLPNEAIIMVLFFTVLSQ